MAHRRNNKSAKTNAVKADHIRAAAEFGIDVSALIDNLGRSPEERIRRHQIALKSIEKLRRAKRV